MLVMGMAVAGCTTHSVGPARTDDDFERKALTTAKDSLSAVETVRLLADASLQGNTLGPYASVAVSEQEDTLASIDGDFRSIQPPSAEAVPLRDELTEIVGQAIDHLADVRIAIRGGDLLAAGAVAAPLAGDAEALRGFMDEVG